MARAQEQPTDSLAGSHPPYDREPRIRTANGESPQAAPGPGRVQAHATVMPNCGPRGGWYPQNGRSERLTLDAAWPQREAGGKDGGQLLAWRGRAVAAVNAESDRTATIYDKAGRQKALVHLDRTTTYGYDKVGSHTLRDDPRTYRIMAYDGANQLVRRRYADGRRHAFSYHAVGNRSMTDPDGGRFTYTRGGAPPLAGKPA